MLGSAFRRASRFGGVRAHPRGVWLFGVLSALPSVLLVVTLGLLIDVVYSHHAGPLEPWTVRAWLGVDAPWAWADRYEYCLLALLGALLVLAALEAVLLRVASRLAESAALRVAGALQAALCEQTRRLDRPAWFAAEHTPTEERLLAACRCVRQGLAAWWTAFPRGVSLLVALAVLMLSIEFFLTLLAILLAIFMYNLNQRLKARAESTAQHHQSQLNIRRDRVLDLLRALRVERGVAGQGTSDETVRATVDRHRQAAGDATAGWTSLRPWLLFLAAFGAALLLLVIGLSPRLNTAHIAILAAGVARLALPLLAFPRVLATVRHAEQPANEVFAYLDEPPAVGQMAGAADLGRIGSEFRWEHVTVGTEAGQGKPLLANASLNVPAKALIAFVGSDPRLAHTVAGLCLRHRDPDAGRLLVDGCDLRQLTLASVRRQIAFAPADGMLLTETVEDNIRCGRSSYTPSDIERAAELCYVSDFIRNLSQGFQTTIGPRGRLLDPSVAFRIGLARAVLGDPSLLLVEEPAEPPDEESGRAMDAALQQIRQNRTVIVFAARLSTLRASERVYLFHQGKLQAEASHAELLQQDALYRHLNYLLFNPFRDAGLQMPAENAR